MATHIPTGDDLSVFLFFCAAMIGFGIATAQETGPKRYLFATCAALSFCCALFWPSLKAFLPKVSNLLGQVANWRISPWIGGVLLGMLIFAAIVEKYKVAAAKIAIHQPDQNYLGVDFDSTNSTGYYWTDAIKTKQILSPKTGMISVETDERVYSIRITNKTNKTLSEIRAYRLTPGRSPQEVPLAFTSHTKRLLHIGASDYVIFATVENLPNSQTHMQGFYILMINCPGFPQITKKVEINTNKHPALSILT